MDTQNTPIHFRMWNHNFWFLTLANLFVTMAAYSLVPFIPMQMHNDGYSWSDIAIIMGSFGLGMFVLGPFVGYWVERYRRNRVCTFAMFLFFVASLGLRQMDVLHDSGVDFMSILGLRLLQGMVYGLAGMVIHSTLVLDTCESLWRTEACHTLSYFSRFGYALGPLTILAVSNIWGDNAASFLSPALALVAIVLISLVKFPFRAPNEVSHRFSLDRFLLPKGRLLFANVLFVTTTFGLWLSFPFPMASYAWLLLGFALAVLAEKYVFADANLKSEALTGMLLSFVSFLLLAACDIHLVSRAVPLLMGLGMGLMGSRYLLFFIKLSSHCQRGSSQSSFFLSWELGIWFGLFLGYSVFHESFSYAEYTAMAIIAIVFLFYNYFLHGWYMNHKNR